jgi:hypothetical protein
MPEPVEDEHLQDFPSAGRAVDYRVFIACARYAPGKPGYITNFFPPYCGLPLGRAYVIDREGQRIASTPREGGGVATAAIPLGQLRGGRGADRRAAFAALTQESGTLPYFGPSRRGRRLCRPVGGLGRANLGGKQRGKAENREASLIP